MLTIKEMVCVPVYVCMWGAVIRALPTLNFSVNLKLID